MNKILLKRGNKADLERVNPLLDSGEPIFIIDENKLKVGDGVTRFNDLPYLDIGERIIEKIKEIQQVSSGGISRSVVQKMIDEAIVSGNFVEVTQGLNSTLTYDISGNLSSIVTARGSKTFGWDNGLLLSISGSGEYVSKSFTYTDGVLTSINIG